MIRKATAAFPSRARRFANTCLVAAILALAACAPLATIAPPTIDFTGEWLLDSAGSSAAPDLTEIRRREDRAVARGRQTNASASAAFAVQDFPILGATRLSIEQSRGSMGIQYDAAGTYRDISWGERQRDFWKVSAGWQEQALVIRSERGDVKGLETLTLEQGGKVLRVAVRVETAGEDIEVVRVYRRR